MAASSISLNFLPRPLRKALLDFQKEGVKFGVRKQGRCLIGDEMGLGKTLQAISIAYYYKDVWPLLIVAPSSVKYSWIDEIEKWLPEVEPQNLNLIRSGSDISNLGKALIHIVGYGLLSAGTSKLLLQALETHKFNIVIIDESHYLKTRRAARTQRLHQLCKKAKHAILLSGTPSLARPRELYFQLDIVCPGKFGSFNKFVKRYCDAHQVYYRGEHRFDTSGASNLPELYHLLKTHVMIRRLKKEVLTQLPPKRRQKVIFDISEVTGGNKMKLQQTMKEFKKCSAILRGDADVDDCTITSPINEMNRLSCKVYKYTGLVKIGPVLKYIEDLAQGMDSKFIVFFRHKRVGEAIEKKLVTMKVKYICIAGHVASGLRPGLVHSFQTDPSVRIAALSIEAASFGLTLTAAHHVVFAELHHTPGVIIQAEDRAHRIGQTLPVNVHYLIARGTVDEILWSMIRRKLYVTSSTLDGKCKELQVEDGDEDRGRQLSACAAWIQDQEEDADDLENFVMEQLSSKTLKKDQSQRDLRSFLVATPSSSQSNSVERKIGYQLGDNPRQKSVEQIGAMNSKEKPITVEDSDEDDFSAWSDLDDDILISEAFEPLPDEKPIDKHNKVCEKNHQNDVKESLNDVSKPDQPLEQATEEKHCPLKPKMLKFKKVKDGKLSFTGSKNYTKLHQKESKCVHISPLKFVGNDPESESQTLRGYLDEECEPSIVKTEQVDDCSVVGGSGSDSGQKERGFLASLQEAAIECVAVVCKRTSNIMQNGCPVSNYTACESVKQEVKHEIDDGHGIRQDSKEGTDLNETKVDILDTPGKTLQNVSPIKLTDSSCKRDGEQEQTSPVKSYSAQGKYSEESCNQMETDFISEVENSDPSCSRGEEHLSGKSCTESGVLTQGDFVGESNGDLELVNVFSNGGGGSVSHETKSAHMDGMANINNGPSSKSVEDRSEENCCSMQSLEVNAGSSTFDNSSYTAKRRAVQEDTDSGEVKTNAASGCADEDSSDDFQVSSIRNSQMVPPECIAKKSSRTKKRKATKKCKNKTAPRKVRNHNTSHKLPSEWPCSACTFINDGQLLECSICLTPRVAIEESSRTPNSTDLGFTISDRRGCDHLEIVETVGVSKSINSASSNCEQNVLVAKHDMALEGINDGSTQQAADDEDSKSLVLPHSTPVRDMSFDSEEVPTDASKARHDSATLEEAMAVDGSDKGQIAEPGLPPWSCSACTFLNVSQMIECSICLTPRRRSQRLSASKNSCTVERQERDCLDRNKSNKRRLWGRDRVKKDNNRQELDVDVVSCSATNIHESRDVNSIPVTHYDENNSVADADGLTPEPTEPSHDADRRLGDAGLKEDSGLDGSGVIKSKPRKRLRLEAFEADSHMSDEIDEFSDEEAVSDNSSPCQQSGSKVEENLEELKAAAEELFMSEWEDDDSWWESDSCSGQSSLPSSSETASSSPAVTSPAFTKCSDLYSVTELKKKLQTTPEQPKNTCTTAVVDNVQRFELTGNLDSKMPSSPATPGSFTPKTAPVLEEEEEADEPDDVPETMKLKFCLSLYTERVYLYDEDNKPLGINFCLSDVKSCNMDDLPAILHHDDNLKQAKRLLEAWKRMGEGKKRILRKSALVFDDPLEAYECARKGITRESSYVRHPSKETQIQNVIDTAGEIGGKIRVVKKPKITGNKRKRNTDFIRETSTGQSSSNPPLSGSTASTGNGKSCYQAVRADGIPLCLFCKGPVDFVDELKCADWDARFCSYDCKREYQVRVSGTAARRALFESERGICQLCFLDAHSLYQSVRVLNLRDRLSFLAGTPYSSLPEQLLRKMVMDPKEGMFWEADHITPVSEGGGECGLDNYRTLCVMCHRKATEDLNRRLKQRKVLQYSAGYADISTFLRPLS